ncbi:M4 family metallopeptidase [Heyndrickxia sp. NPDC080065]|uniref:M4 family metallopeptidase n=1 Tax=Heyndrickxia sp. NPDC080065 TaxID=3390568 RepID=UPI003D092230
MKKVIPAVLAASLTFGGLAFPLNHTFAAEKVKYDQQLKTPSSIIGLWKAPEGVSKQEALYAFLQSKASLFKSTGNAKDQFKIVKEQVDSNTNTTHFRTVEQYNGIPIYGSAQTTALDKDNNVFAFFGKVTPNLARAVIPTTATVSKDEAIQVAKQNIEEQIGEVNYYDGDIDSDLMIYPYKGKNYLAYVIKASTSKPEPGYWHYFIDATNGNIIHSFNAIQEALPENPDPVQARGMDIFGKLQTFQAVKDPNTGAHYLFDGTRSKGVHTFNAMHLGTDIFIILSALLGYTGDEVKSPSNFFYDPAAVSAHINAEKVYDYYQKTFKRNSLDDKGMKIISSVHIGDKWNNAAWNGKQMLYGDGDGQRMISLSGGLDVIGHEMTHGVISNTADLEYEGESGALNESLADIMGSFIENKTDEGLWLMGEDIWTPDIPGDGLRSLSDPASVYIGGYTESGYYPDHYSQRYLGDQDHGGVHVNSSINNKAAYLLTQGGTHYGVTVQGIGKAKAEKIFYRALTLYLTSSSDFSQMRQAMTQAARDLYPDKNGAPSAEVQAINDAYDAVGVY